MEGQGSAPAPGGQTKGAHRAKYRIGVDATDKDSPLGGLDLTIEPGDAVFWLGEATAHDRDGAIEALLEGGRDGKARSQAAGEVIAALNERLDRGETVEFDVVTARGHSTVPYEVEVIPARRRRKKAGRS